jgi:hypothetical protein
LKANFESQMADFERLALTMDLSIPKDAPVALDDIPSGEVTSKDCSVSDSGSARKPEG